VKTRFSHIVMLISAILAFVPVLAVDFLLDGYVRGREASYAQVTLNAITAQTQRSVYDGINSIRHAIDRSPSFCTPTFVRNMQLELKANFALRQMLVENPDGVQYCDAFGDGVNFTPLSATIAIPGHEETLTLVRLGGVSLPVLKLTRIAGTKLVSAFVLASPRVAQGLPSELKDASSFRMVLANGDAIVSLGDGSGLARRADGLSFIVVNSFAGELPIRAEVAILFSTLRAAYSQLDVSLTIIACLMSGAFLVTALHYVRRSQIPSFDLENAIATGELKPYYQPVIDLRTGRLLGCEVLVRWQKRNGEIVPPGVFIDYAEVTGLAIPMTVNLMESVKNDLATLCAELPHLKISINLFEGHFRDSSIVEDVQAIFGGTPIKFRQLVFEITERRPLANDIETMTVINGLHALGARLALDDVGTGHSNLAYVQTLGADIIKIDRVFVDMVKEDTTQVPVLDGLITMARELGTDIVAEGVETQAQAIYLRARGVIQAQGFLFAPALKAESFIALARGLNGRMGSADNEAGDGATSREAAAA